ncbi:MAG: MaoC family dehydratase [Porticoccaceae bacterium]
MDNVGNKNQSPLHSVTPLHLEGPPNVALLLAKALIKIGKYRIGNPLPPLTAHWENLHIDQSHLQDYNRICGFESNQMPATYLWVRAFPLIMSVLVSRQFPLPAMGQVHLRNQISVHSPLDLDKPFNITAAVDHSELSSKGLEWSMQISVTAVNQIVWSSRSTFLYRCNTGIERSSKPLNKAQGDQQSWQLPSDLGRHYASISGDYNPIHLSAFSAKLFGFKQAIAHGMWSKARCLAAMNSLIPQAGYSVNVNFLKPVFLPSKVNFYSDLIDSQRQFSLFNASAEQMHLQGSIS